MVLKKWKYNPSLSMTTRFGTMIYCSNYSTLMKFNRSKVSPSSTSITMILKFGSSHMMLTILFVLHTTLSWTFSIMMNQIKSQVNGSNFGPLNIPPKFKHHIWRIQRDFLPTRVRLHSKGVQCPSTCALRRRDNKRGFLNVVGFGDVMWKLV